MMAAKRFLFFLTAVCLAAVSSSSIPLEKDDVHQAAMLNRLERLEKTVEMLEKMNNEHKQRLESLEMMNKNQEKEIASLKAQINVDSKTIERNRPIDGDKNQKDNIRAQRGDIVPSSCEELNAIGHSLNGFYMVQKPGKIEAVFCYFDYPTTPGRVVERTVGFVNVQSHPVNFYVQRNNDFEANFVIVPFEVEVLNVGSAFKLDTGVFKAPVSGTYHFSLLGVKDASTNGLSIQLQHNGATIAWGYGSSVIGGAFTYGLEATLKLAAGDRVNLYKTNGVMAETGAHLTHFTGFLIEEDLQPVSP